MLINKQLLWIAAAIIFLQLGVSGCTSVPGETEDEQVETIDALIERTLSDLYKQSPETKKEIAQSVGYIVMNNKVTKVPMVGAGAGYGVAINTKTDERTYLRMARFDVGGGWGARSVRPVLIFQDEAIFKDFIDGKWEAQAGAEAAAKAGDAGVAGGAGSGNLINKGYSIYMITDAGVSATATAGIIRVKPISLKE